jgi:hypothetical protein
MEESASEREPVNEDQEATESPGDVDAIGNDKRRAVVGQQYGASARKQLTVYGIFIAVVVGLAILFLTVVSNVDNREIPLEDTAPWTQASASQEPPRDVDFPRNGPQDTIPADEIGKAPLPQKSDSVSGG